MKIVSLNMSADDDFIPIFKVELNLNIETVLDNYMLNSKFYEDFGRMFFDKLAEFREAQNK